MHVNELQEVFFLLSKKNKVALIPLGGLGEIGKNMWAVEYRNEILVIDAGLMFPDEDMLGIDVVIPDISYLMEHREKIVGIILTHGHEDHIGALPYVIKQLNVPVYGSRLTLALAETKLKEHGLERKVQLIPVNPRDALKIGSFKVEFINVNHSIAGVLALAIHTPVGIIVHTADFKIDHTPVDGEPLDFRKFAELGEKGVLVLLSDSTNVEQEGYTVSERVLAEKFEEFFHGAEGRLIVTTFASNIHRIQQVVNAAVLHRRKVAFIGRSMVNVVSIAKELGYLKIPDGLAIDLDEVQRLPANEVVLVTTGSQGEPLAALSRMAMGEHRRITIMPGDTVIISASAIPGNEKLIARTINHLYKQGARVIYEALTGVHVSGHARQEELKLMLQLVKPKFFVPVHGEYRHLVQHARLAQDIGVPNENVFIAENGDVLEFTANTGRIAGRVPAGRIFVDGLGVGDVGNVVLRDRKQLSQDGILIAIITLDRDNGQVLAGPDIISRGFVYVRESEALMEEVRVKVIEALDKCQTQGNNDWAFMKGQIRETLSRFLYERTKRRPMILPIITEV